MSKQGFFLVGGFHVKGQLARSYYRAFEATGQAVDGFDMVAGASQLEWPTRSRILYRLTVRSLGARRLWSSRLNASILQSARSSRNHWVLIFNGEWVMPETVQALKRMGKRVAIFHADNPLRPHTANRPETLDAARESDLYLIWSQLLAEKLKRMGVKRTSFMPFGWDPVECPYRDDLVQGSWPGVLFVGNWDREREEFLDEISARVPVRIYGADYWKLRTRPTSRARRSWMGRELSLFDAAKVIRESAISLNILRKQHIIDGKPDGVIMRHFEVPGAGGFLLSTRSGGATELLPEDKAAAYFTGTRECLDVCARHLADTNERRRMATEGHANVAARHTYENRAREISALLEPLG